MGFRLFEHTADVGIEAHGDDAGECLAHAAHGLVQVLTGQTLQLRSGVAESFTVEAPDLEALAVAFLSELLYKMEATDRFWTSGGVDVRPGGDGWVAEAHGNLATFDAAHGHGVEVKAITYHGIRFGSDDGKWHLRVVLDI